MFPNFSGPVRTWRFRQQTLELGSFPLLMAIVNVTPDSFSDQGQFHSRDAAIQRSQELIEQGADVLDIGGESTRPGAEPISLEEELARVIPVIRELAKFAKIPLSVDTTKAEVARQALDAGAAIINDVSGLTWDPEMPEVCARGEAGVICMHIRGTPQTMQTDPTYADVVPEIAAHLNARLIELEQQGVSREAVVLDPGIGFGKTAVHNLEILSHIQQFRDLGRPVCVGHSRKRFLGKILNRPVDERVFGTVGVSLALAVQATDIIRLHEIAPTRDCLLAWRAVMNART